jgi:hypothetical protein
MNIEFGIGLLNMYNIDSNGDTIGETLAVSSYDAPTRVITLGSAISEIAVDKDVIFHKEDDNEYSFGVITDTTHITLGDDADDTWLKGFTDNIEIYDGINASVYEGATITQTSTGQAYRGKGLFQLEFYSTDIDTTLSATNLIFNEKITKFLNGIQGTDFSGGNALAIMDNEFNPDVNIDPKDVRVQIIRKRTRETDKFEEVILHRVKTGELEIPTERDAFMQDSFDLEAQTKSLFDEKVITYTVEE